MRLPLPIISGRTRDGPVQHHVCGQIITGWKHEQQVNGDIARDLGLTCHELETWTRYLGSTDDELETWAKDLDLTDHVSETPTGQNALYRSRVGKHVHCTDHELEMCTGQWRCTDRESWEHAPGT